MTTSPLALSLFAPIAGLGILALFSFAPDFPTDANDSNDPTVDRIWSSGRTTPYTHLGTIEADQQAKRVGKIIAEALTDLGGESPSWITALRTVESQFHSIQLLPAGTVYCYEYDPETNQPIIVCKEKRSARVIENAGDSAVELHFDWSTTL